MQLKEWLLQYGGPRVSLPGGASDEYFEPKFMDRDHVVYGLDDIGQGFSFPGNTEVELWEEPKPEPKEKKEEMYCFWVDSNGCTVWAPTAESDEEKECWQKIPGTEQPFTPKK